MRRSGRGARGSSSRASFAFIVVTVSATVSLCRRAISVSRSMSRAISVDLLTMPRLNPLVFANTSSSERVIFCLRSMGW